MAPRFLCVPMPRPFRCSHNLTPPPRHTYTHTTFLPLLFTTQAHANFFFTTKAREYSGTLGADETAGCVFKLRVQRLGEENSKNLQILAPPSKGPELVSASVKFNSASVGWFVPTMNSTDREGKWGCGEEGSEESGKCIHSPSRYVVLYSTKSGATSRYNLQTICGLRYWTSAHAAQQLHVAPPLTLVGVEPKVDDRV